MPNGLPMFLIYDYINIFKNLRNNWISEALKLLSFHIDAREYLACWSINLYEEDKKNPIRLTKLTRTSIYPKPLQRQSVSLVHQVFNEKTRASLKEPSAKINISLGTLLFVQIISDWFKIMNIKDKFIHQRVNDKLLSPWSQNCESFTYLEKVCDVIASCQWEGGCLRQQKLTKFTASVFVVTTKNVISATNYLLRNYDFQYVLPAAFSQNPFEKFFGQTRQRIGGNFYIDINVISAAKAQRFHQFIKTDIVPVDGGVKNICTL